MQIDLKIDSSQLQGWALLAEKKLAWGAVRAINATALHFQKLVRARVRQIFTVRTDFVLREAAIIDPFANVGKARPFAEVRVGTKRRFLLPFFEEGAVKLSEKGKTVAVPLTGEAARPSWPTSVPQALWITRLKLRRQKPATAASLKRHGRQRGTVPIRVGLEGTHLTPRVGIFQRRGRESHLIYSFQAGPNLDARLGYYALAEGMAQTFFAEEMERQLVDAVAHEAARGRL